MQYSQQAQGFADLQGAGTNEIRVGIHQTNYSTWAPKSKEEYLDRCQEFYMEQKPNLFREVPRPEPGGYVDPKVAQTRFWEWLKASVVRTIPS